MPTVECAGATLLVRIERAGVSYGGRSALADVNLRLSAGEFVTVIGPNGAGKTTLLRILLGLLEPSAGTVWRAPGLRVGYVPQRLALDPTLPLSVKRFLTLTLRASRARLLAALEETGVPRLLDASLHTLSGGELQRILLARALLRDPQLLVLDEPLQGVDGRGQTELLNLIARTRAQRGCAVLMVSHELHLLLGATDRLIALDGAIQCDGPPADLARDPRHSHWPGGMTGSFDTADTAYRQRRHG